MNLSQVANRVLHSMPIAEAATRLIFEGCEDAFVYGVSMEGVWSVESVGWGVQGVDPRV